jgi:peptidoglycan LD-endopeptidase CwlK
MALDYVHNDEVTPEIGAYAQEILKAHGKEPWGTCYYRDFDGKTFVFRLEMHYHEPGGSAKPWGKDTGVSVLHLVEDTAPETVRSETFFYGKLSKSRLIGVDSRLVATFNRAIEITTIDITIVEGLRSKEKQAAAVKSGASFTMNSRHLTGHAIDAAPYVNGAISWKWEHFRMLAPYIFEAAKQVKCPIEWGGNWPAVTGKSQPDGLHWQIPWRI